MHNANSGVGSMHAFRGLHVIIEWRKKTGRGTFVAVQTYMDPLNKYNRTDRIEQVRDAMHMCCGE
jgi:hypothetical protein